MRSKQHKFYSHIRWKNVTLKHRKKLYKSLWCKVGLSRLKTHPHQNFSDSTDRLCYEILLYFLKKSSLKKFKCVCVAYVCANIVCVHASVTMHVCEHEDRTWYPAFSSCFSLFRQALSVNLKFILWLDWLARKPQVPLLCHIIPLVLELNRCIVMLMFVSWRYEVIASCLLGKHCIYWSTFQALEKQVFYLI